MTKPLSPCGGYSAGHPWYYVLGGTVPRIKQIQADALSLKRCGYLAEDIQTAHALPEPQRSNKLKGIRASVKQTLRSDISRYREVARELHKLRAREEAADAQPSCQSVHTSMSLKFCHIMNDFAHLNLLDSLPKQLDLFG